MSQVKLPAVFMRGGSSKGVFFRACDLPPAGPERDRLFLAVLGSPDPYGRQLNGMGGGISSLSKVAIVDRAARPDADVDYTFGQVAVDRPLVDYGSACGNLASAVGPFAIEEGLIESRQDGTCSVRIFNTNTQKIYHAHFEVRGGRAVETGDFAIAGVAGSGAKIRLDFLDPGGAASRGFLPSGEPLDIVDLPGRGRFEVSLVDATNPVAFVSAEAVGCSATEFPEELDANRPVMELLELLRRACGVRMGIASRPEEIPLSNPKIALVAGPAPFVSLSKDRVSAEASDVMIRIVSMEKAHRAVTLTGAMCLAAACRVIGSLPHRLVRATSSLAEGEGAIRVANPSGILPVDALVEHIDGKWAVRHTVVYRTARRLMSGWVHA